MKCGLIEASAKIPERTVSPEAPAVHIKRDVQDVMFDRSVSAKDAADTDVSASDGGAADPAVDSDV